MAALASCGSSGRRRRGASWPCQADFSSRHLLTRRRSYQREHCTTRAGSTVAELIMRRTGRADRAKPQRPQKSSRVKTAQVTLPAT
eukprot:7131412-Prymnesium_polylepis.1